MEGKTDYSQMALGTTIDDGVIMKCPKCGRLGLATHDPTIPKIYYTHSQAIAFEPGSVFGNEAFSGIDYCIVDDSEPSTLPASH